MTHRNAKIHPAMTALAAVFALSATPLLAQSTDAPVVTTTPVVDVTPAPVAVDPIAPAAEAPVAADPLGAETAPTPVRKATAVKKTAAKSRPAPARVSQPARSVAAAPAAAIAAPIAEAPVVQQLPPPTEIAADPIPAPADGTSIDLLRTAGLGLLALLVLAGGWLVFRSRRRRRAEEAEDAEWQQQAEAEPEAAAEPAMMVEPEPAMAAEPELVPAEPAPAEPALAAAALAEAAAPEPAPATESTAKFIGPVADLPEGFDLSRFGPNVQDAYRGPTEDNPSASLKHRLSRASGMDQQERKLDAEVEAVTGEPVLDESDTTPPAEAPAAKPSVIHHVDGDFILGRDGKKKNLTPTYTQ